ncbi:type II toxin-antitoxin system VapC family toxin [Methylohalobius crimeensis]|uniref:type II toxin-antitoxin system VapC family toxin n=1 Tax=Methylohalobius crimeensis TaxID=244365 RepID=UPI0003B30C23|nr:PIN domain-containing protein [Methylohalobius crimeensis]
MASLIYLDTHVVAWLYAYGRDAVPQRVGHLLEQNDDIRISPMVRLELQYLFEIGRVGKPPLPVLDALASALGLVVCKAAFPAIVREAESQTWTRDPFDRLIVAQANLFNALLVTKDATIHANYGRAIWGQR